MKDQIFPSWIRHVSSIIDLVEVAEGSMLYQVGVADINKIRDCQFAKVKFFIPKPSAQLSCLYWESENIFSYCTNSYAMRILMSLILQQKCTLGGEEQVIF